MSWGALNEITAYYVRNVWGRRKPMNKASNDLTAALAEIGLEQPSNERLLNAVLRALGLPECKGGWVSKKNCYTSVWTCECGANPADCPCRASLETLREASPTAGDR